ncbi:hypothetical protein [Streptomyces hokutonensis]|uniref:hypothetical protein n=1 Tax=Streptomyces hokutonensis TaxID=1306990 RepID=UPI00131A4487|nr:hypothetical protein [Streptomyces hokutonensis]
MAWRVLVGAASTSTALALWAIVRTAVVAHAQWMPGPPVIQQFLQIPLGLGLALTLWRPEDLLLRGQRVPSAGPTQP